MHDVLSHSLAAGRLAGRKVIEGEFRQVVSFSLKHDNSLVTRVDSESQELLMSYLKKQFPSVPS
jgi:3'-phosphoadenosine 5'-phosphosulfate (PAPS) 3'-phosphatase